MLCRFRRPVLAGLFMFGVSPWLIAGGQDPEVIRVPPAAVGPAITAPIIPGIPPGPGLLPRPLVPGDFPVGAVTHPPVNVVYGVREIGCYHPCPEYYSPYHVRPLIEPAIAASMVRSQLAHLGIKVNPPDDDKAKEKIPEQPKEREELKEPKRDR
jgi:hypothetical protein